MKTKRDAKPAAGSANLDERSSLKQGNSKSYGKIPLSFLENVIYTKLGAARPEILVGPKTGVDTGVVKIGSNQVLVVTCDPLSLLPELGPEDSAWMSVNLISNDLSTSGLTPQYMMVDLNLPPEMPESVLEKYWTSFSNECDRLGIAIVGGHTGKFEGCDYTIIGSGTAFSTGARSRCLTSSGAQRGDSVILTKGAAISATAIFAKAFPNKVREVLGDQGQRRAAEGFEMISATEDALKAVSAGVGKDGVTAMHDVTEGGVLSAMYDIAKASSLGMLANKMDIPISEETKNLCKGLSIDPYITLGEGALVITCSRGVEKEVLEALQSRGTACAVIGQMVEPEKGVIVKDGGSSEKITGIFQDPYWNAYYDAVNSRWT
jgi:hydrogenase expression/formation protein HypE